MAMTGSELCVPEDVLPGFLGRPSETPSPIIKSFLYSIKPPLELRKGRSTGFGD